MEFHCFITSIIVLFTASSLQADSEITVTTNLGSIIGKVGSISVGPNTVNISYYLGIPFAKPPVGELRFAKPVSTSIFSEPFRAFKNGPVCPQNISPLVKMSEDCLHLNIFSPATGPTNTKYAVIIWIHGGSFVFGSGIFGPKGVMAGLRDVIVVAINYRLGVFGFMDTEDGTVVGNYGLWDQHLAIRWVHDNIASFNGDPNRVTIMGESAGAAAVMFQAIYPGNEGMFQRVIVQSGSAGAYWATIKSPRAKFTEFAKVLNCQKSTTSESVTCLRSLTNITLLNLKSIIDSAGGELDWAPTVDGEFVTEERIKALTWPVGTSTLAYYNNLDLMIGTTGSEGQSFINIGPNKDNYDKIFLNASASLNSTKQAVADTISLVVNVRLGEELGNEVVDDVMFYYSNFQNPTDRNMYIEKAVDLITDINFYVPTYTALENRLYQQGTAKTYQYEFNEVDPFGPKLPWVRGAIHADELKYLFGSVYGRAIDNGLSDADISSQWLLAKRLITYWTNFAKTGNPNMPVNVPTAWTEHKKDESSYLSISSKMITNGAWLHRSRTAFWVEYIPSLIKRVEELQKVKDDKPNKNCDTTSGTVVIANVLVYNIFCICTVFLY